MSTFNLPDQTISETLKNEDWHMNHALELAKSFTGENQEEVVRLFRAYHCDLSEEEIELKKIITCPHGVDMGVPYTIYPLIRSKIEQIVGEYYLRPKKKKLYAIDKKSKVAKLDEKLKMVSEEIVREMKEGLSEEMGFDVDTENPEMQLPEDIEEFFEKDFKTLAEQTGQSLIDFLLTVRKEEKKFKQIFVNYLIADRCHGVIDEKEKHVTIRNVHPIDSVSDKDPYKNVQDDHLYFFENYWITENDIYNTFPNLTKKQKEEVKGYFSNVNGLHIEGQNTYNKNDIGATSSALDGDWYQALNNVGRIRLVYGMWKSRKIIRYKESVDNYENTHYKKLGDEDKIKDKDVIKTIDIEIPRHVIALGPNICLSYGVNEERLAPMDNKFICKLPVISLIRENTTGSSKIKSLAAVLEPLQEMASEVFFELRLALRKAGDDRITVYDTAQTPKALNKGSVKNSINRVMHHMKKDKMLFINSKERGAKNTFNQFTSLDVSQKNGIKVLFEGLSIIEDLADKFSGIYPEREGKVGQYQTATGTERAVRGSAARTEVYFNPFDDFTQELINRMLIKCKHYYKEGDVIEYVIGNLKTKFIKVFKEFFEADLGIYLSDGQRDQEIASKIDQAAEMALSTSNAPDMVLGFIDVLEGETASEKKDIFNKMLKKMEEMREEANKAAQEQAAAEQKEEAAKLAQEKDIADEQNIKDIVVANIYKSGDMEGRQVDNLSREKIKAAELMEKQRSEESKSLQTQN